MNRFVTASFLKNSNIYEVNLRQYTPEGSIQAFLHHLPRLRDMGVEILWLMPIHPIGSLKRKGSLGSYYSIKDFCDVNPEFGTRRDFKELVIKAHDHGMKLIIDWVANHAAWDNVWTIDHPGFFVRDEQGNFKPPYDWDDVIQIDHSNKEQQDAMLNAMKYWVTEFNIDGFRADLAHLTPLQFWMDARNALDKVKPSLTWLAETEDIPYYQAFDIVYAWKWMHATEDFFKKNQSVQVLTDTLKRQKYAAPAGAVELFFTSNHDENSWNGTEYEKYGIYAKALAVFNYTYQNAVPLMYSGQELPNLKRLKFFEKDLIQWSDNLELHSFYKTLNTFHKNTFKDGELQFFEADKNILAFSHSKGDNVVLTFLNLDKERCTSNFINEKWTGTYRNIFSGEMVSIEAVFKVELAPGEFLVLEK